MAGENTPVDTDYDDALQIAVKFERTDARLDSLALAQANISQNLTNVMQGLQAEVRDVGQKMSVIAQLEHDRQAHSEGLARAFEAIAKLSAMSERQWEQQKIQEDAYRERVAIEHKATRDKLLRWSGASLAASLFIGMLVSTLGYIYVTDKNTTSAAVAAVSAAQVEHSKEADHRFDKIEGVLIEMCVKQGKDCQFR
jgi:hypothetical protein